METSFVTFDVAFVAWILGMAWLGLHSWRSGACMRRMVLQAACSAAACFASLAGALVRIYTCVLPASDSIFTHFYTVMDWNCSTCVVVPRQPSKLTQSVGEINTRIAVTEQPDEDAMLVIHPHPLDGYVPNNLHSRVMHTHTLLSLHPPYDAKPPRHTQ